MWRKKANILALAKGCERYVFYYDDCPETFNALLDTFDRFAGEEGCNFNAADAVLLAQKARETARRCLNKT